MIEQLEQRLLCYAAYSRWAWTSAGGNTGPTGHYATVGYSIVNDGTALPNSEGEAATASTLQATMDKLAPRATWMGWINTALTTWSKASGLEYVRTVDDGKPVGFINGGQNGVRGDVRIAGHPIDGPGGVLAYTFFPAAGDIVLDTDDMRKGGYFSTAGVFIAALEHESGHALGLDHSTVPGDIMAPTLTVNPGADNVTPLGPDATAGVRSMYGLPPIAGDANRDGRVNIEDYGAIDYHIGLGVAGWANGDFNYDGRIDISDYGIIDFAVGHQAGGPSPIHASSRHRFAA